MRPIISVVITNYNYAQYLPSVVASARGADELIVVDDGSADGSREVLAGVPGITLILKPNGGHVSSVNAGYAASHGDVVVFLDADDLLLGGCFDAVRAAWTPKASKVQWGLLGIDANGAPTSGCYPRFAARHTPDWCRREMARQCWYDAPPTSGNAWSRKFLEKVMPLPRLGSRIWALDDYLHLLAPYFGDVISLAESMGDYRIHASQMSGHSRFSVDRQDQITSDEVLRYTAVNAVLAKHGFAQLDPLRWYQHTLNRIFMCRLGRRRESIWPLLARHIKACIRSDTSAKSKIMNILLGGALTIPSPALAYRLALLKYQPRQKNLWATSGSGSLPSA